MPDSLRDHIVALAATDPSKLAAALLAVLDEFDREHAEDETIPVHRDGRRVPDRFEASPQTWYGDRRLIGETVGFNPLCPWGKCPHYHHYENVHHAPDCAGPWNHPAFLKNDEACPTT